MQNEHSEQSGLHIEVVGDGPDVVLAHGFGGSARNWRPQVRALSGRYRVITYDARGHARSGGGAFRADPAMSDLVADMESVCARAEVRTPCVVGGLSLGAATALAFAAAGPERVRGLFLASYPASARSPGSLGARAAAFAAALEAEGLEGAGSRFVWGPGSGLDERGAALVRQGFLEHDAGALAGILRGVIARWQSPAALAASLPALAAPALLLSGGLDAGSIEAAAALAPALPGARVEVVEGAGHVVNLAAPKAVNALLLDWLDRLSPGREISSGP